MGDPVVVPPMEFEIERTEMLNTRTGDFESGFRVRYRPDGERRWTKFVASVTQPVSDEKMPEVGLLMARRHYAMEHKEATTQ